MENRLQELTEKIYREGVEKGNEEASRLVAAANLEAQRLVKEAEHQAGVLIAKARAEAADIRRSAHAELKLTYNQAVSSLKQEIAGLVTGAVAQTAGDRSYRDPEFFNSFLLSLARSWGEKQALVLSIPENDEKGIEAYLAGHAADLLNKGIQIEKVAGIKTGFRVGPADGRYKVSFTDADFDNFLKELLRPRMVALLFGN